MVDIYVCFVVCTKTSIIETSNCSLGYTKISMSEKVQKNSFVTRHFMKQELLLFMIVISKYKQGYNIVIGDSFVFDRLV